jgi:benzoyl-CoA reductase/2-hydroxyglutaryl-CoA dehydratase subunit BcrC/BadD/HgdB
MAKYGQLVELAFDAIPPQADHAAAFVVHVAAYQLIESEEQAFIASKGIKKVGFLCAYTPMELLNAAGVSYVRLMKAGVPTLVGAGELHTQSVLCVPKNRAEPASRRYFRDEIVDFKRDLEVLTGKAIVDDEVRKQIVLYNKIRLGA